MKDEMDTIQELMAVEQQILETIQEYLDDKGNYPDDVVLAINSTNYEIVIDSPSNLSDEYEQYQLSSLIRQDEQGNPEPDCDATNDIANQYYFVR